MMMKRIVTASFSLLASSAGAQQPAAPPTVGVVDAPCAGREQAPPSVAAYLTLMANGKAAHTPVPPPAPETLKLYQDWQERLRNSDFPALCRYQAANAALPAATDHRVVFFGDSITEIWALSTPQLFTNDVIDRGISGQTTEQMIGRFRADVIDLHPRVVHIMAGTNDIAGNTGATSLAWIENNILTMVELAEAHHINVVLASIPPSAKFGWRPSLAPAAIIAAYNAWLRNYAVQHHTAYIDYYHALDDGHGGMAATLSDDGVHPNDKGFAVMTPLGQQTIRASLRAAH